MGAGAGGALAVVLAAGAALAGIRAATCLFTRAGFRRRGISRALARAAVDLARTRGARAAEGYPIIADNVNLGGAARRHPDVYRDAGLVEVGHPTPRRIAMRLDFRRARRTRWA